MTDLYQLALIWACVFLSSLLAERTRLTPMLYFLAFGSLLVNVGLLPEEGTPFLEVFSDIGIILIMFALGFEENSSRFVQGIRRSWGIALFGAVFPFLTAYAFALSVWGDEDLALLSGLAMTATAVSLTMVSLKGEGLQTSAAATGIMTSAVLDDIASLALLAIMVPMVTGGAEPSVAGVLGILFKAVIFFALVTLIGLWVFPHQLSQRWLTGIPVIGRYGIRDLLSHRGGQDATLIILLLALIFGLVGHGFGFHPGIGAYMAGLILKEEYFQFHGAPEIDHYRETKKIIDNVAFSWIGPVFFVELGSKLVFDGSLLMAILPGALVLGAGLFLAQTLSAGLAARYTGHFHWHESVMIGLGMLGRAELALVVLDIGYVENHIFTTEAFYTLMLTAFCLNVLVPVGIRVWKPYYLGDKSLCLGRIRLSRHPPEP